MEKKTYSKPVLMAERFEPQAYVASCTWRATLHCGVYGNRTYRQGNDYIYEGMPHGTACQNTVVTVREDKNGNLTVTGQEVPKGSAVIYQTAPTFHWGTKGPSAPGSPTSSNKGALYSEALWDSKDINGTGDYKHIGYVASWEEFEDGNSIS